MNKTELINYVDEYCDAMGMDAPAYDLIYNDCRGRSMQDTKEMVETIIVEYNL